MLSFSVLNILSNGIYISNLLVEYRRLNFLKIIHSYFGIYKYFLFLIFKKIEFQVFKNYEVKQLFISSSKAKEHLSHHLPKYRLFNLELMRLLPPFKRIKKLYNNNILRKFLIKSHSGKSHLLGKPVRGQRTRSNAKNSKLVNSYLRQYIKSKKLMKNSN